MKYSNDGFGIMQLPRERLAKMLADQKNNLLYVAKDGDEVLGYLAGYDVGAGLLKAMLEEVKNRGYFCIICHIVLEPYHNQASITFHTSFGFKEIGRAQENEIRTGVYLKML